MAARPRWTVVLLSAPATLAGIDSALRKAGVRLIRLVSLEARPVDPARWLGSLRRVMAGDIVVVTSRYAVEAGVRAWRKAGGRLPRSLEFWAVGPGTARALRRAGIRPVHRPAAVGREALAGALGPRPHQTIVYFRSDHAGNRLARALRQRGHRVIDLVVYRVDPPARLPRDSRSALASADLLVVTSPSGLSGLRRRLGPARFSELARTKKLVVLGERSRRAARAHGFRRTSIAPRTTAQGFTRHLLRELRDADA